MELAMLAAWPLLTSGPGAREHVPKVKPATTTPTSKHPAPARNSAAAGGAATATRRRRAGKNPAASSPPSSPSSVPTSRITQHFEVPGLGWSALFEGRVCASTGWREGRGRVVVLQPVRRGDEDVYEAGVALVARWRNGVPEGPISLTETEDGATTVVAEVTEDGLCGDATEYYADGDVKFCGEYACSERHCEQGIEYLPCGATLTGQWREGVFTGPDNTYTYPGGRTFLRGAWDEQGSMSSATAWCIIDHDGDARVAVPHPDVPRGTVFHYDPSDERTMSSTPSLGDPHERASCFVATSTLPGGGAGISDFRPRVSIQLYQLMRSYNPLDTRKASQGYARVPLDAGVVCSYYSGIRLPTVEANRRTWAENEYTISLYSGAREDVFSGENEDEDGAPDTAIDVPHATLPWYSATLGHLVNHSDKPNVEFEFMVHPRFGEIKCLRTLRAIRAGEELLVDYGYGAFRERTPPVWFESRTSAPE